MNYIFEVALVAWVFVVVAIVLYLIFNRPWFYRIVAKIRPVPPEDFEPGGVVFKEKS